MKIAGGLKRFPELSGSMGYDIVKFYLLCGIRGRFQKTFYFCSPARMAELVDALVSGTSVRKDVQVRVLFRVHFS